MDVQPGTIVLYCDIACPWATLAVHRYHEARRRTGSDVDLDLRCFPLELVNERPTPKPVLDAEIPAVGALAPEAFRPWAADPATWPVTVLLALEAVQAAKEQGLQASASLDLALRRAMFVDHRCISMLTVVLDVAREVDGLDAAALEAALVDGRARRTVLEQLEVGRTDEVDGSPHAFLPDGTDAHNPGVDFHWEGEPGEGFPVVDADDPKAWDDLIRRAAG